MFGADPREMARGDDSGFDRTAITRTLMKTEGDLPLMAPIWSGGFANELFHTGSSQEGLLIQMVTM